MIETKISKKSIDFIYSNRPYPNDVPEGYEIPHEFRYFNPHRKVDVPNEFCPGGAGKANTFFILKCVLNGSEFEMGPFKNIYMLFDNLMLLLVDNPHLVNDTEFSFTERTLEEYMAYVKQINANL